MKQVFKLM